MKTNSKTTAILQKLQSELYFDLVGEDLHSRLYFDPTTGGIVFYNSTESGEDVFLMGHQTEDSIKVHVHNRSPLCDATWTLRTRSEPALLVFRIVDPALDTTGPPQKKNPLNITSFIPRTYITLAVDRLLGGQDWRTLEKKTGSNSVYTVAHSGFRNIVMKTMWTPKLRSVDIRTKAHCWMREWKIHAKLSHVCIVRFLGCDRRSLSIFVERIHGPSLADMRDQNQRWNGREMLAQALWLDGADTLIYLENQNIVHEDIKLSNLLPSMHSGGTPCYVAPEAWARQERNTASDMYSFGVVMLFVLQYLPLPECYNDWHIGRAMKDNNSSDYKNMRK
ncbi:kinase-like protein [Setomelanomma holmii]|uniref:Kinase-like protein n=1 Tax=Setomelanomma holmii TaxID=210430 RepID=A0A9P4GX10_9PLEO|nr:kinase-like protein [Setomelanomma holmii]